VKKARGRLGLIIGRAETGSDRERRGVARSTAAAGAVVRAGFVAWVLLLAGCVTQGDFLRLQEKVAELHDVENDSPDPFERIARLSAKVDALDQKVNDLQGELELARREAADALKEVERTRAALALSGAGRQAPSAGEAGGAAAGNDATAAVAAVGTGGDAPSIDEELASYQAALEAWRQDDFKGCIDRFTAFLQSYPTSGYADDAAYWLADCTFKNDEFKRAVVRFNAVVSVYPESPKAPDALYRQGESLLKLGPKFHEAARTVFKRVQKDYPDSERAAEAGRQLERLGSG
jgi:tol-pal system protein YbgF